MNNKIAEKFVEAVVQNVSECHERIKHRIYWTPLLRSMWLSEETNKTSVYFKLESEQVTGSFKVRGVFNKIQLIKTENERLREQKFVTTASSGNHGLACALAMQTLGMNGTIFLNESASTTKIESIEKLGANVALYGDDTYKAEVKAKEFAQENNNYIYVPPYTDVDLVNGAATICLEILHDLQDVDTIFVTVGGGGLISGIAAYAKKCKPSVKIIGCQPKNSCVMFESVKEGRVLDLVSYPTLSDGSAGGVDPDAFTFDICCTYVDEWVLVTEDEISKAMFFMLDKHHKLIEGAAACTIAAYMKNKSRHIGQNIVLVICGSNVAIESINEVIKNNSTK